MKVPIHWLREYVKVPSNLKDLTDKLTMVGHMLDGKTSNKNGVTIDLELRGNRADCYSILGIAREVSAIYGTPVKNPTVLKNLKKSSQLKSVALSVRSKNAKRVVMSIVRNVKITKSPDWLKNKLVDYGVDSINNIVDLTNFVAIELGEPMHAFDLDKVGKKLYIRESKKGEKMVTFQDKTLTLTDDDLVWANGKDILSVAGAIGGKHHSITDSTKNILIEAASYERVNIRRSVHRHNLFTEAGIRHEKELDPNMVGVAVARFLYLVDKYKWGKVTSLVSEYNQKPVTPWGLELNFKNLTALSGVEVSEKETKDILRRLNFEITRQDPDSIEVLVPTYRTDVTKEADLIEEVLRIYGYDKIPVQTLSLPIPEDVTPDYIKQELETKSQLVSLGFNEVISSSFVKEDFQSLNNTEDLKVHPVELQNPPSPDFKEMRTTLLPNLVEISLKAVNERATRVYYFEVGKVYTKKQSSYIESRRLGVLYFDKESANFGKFKGFIEAYFLKNNIKNTKYESSIDFPNLTSAFEISVGKSIVGHGGVYKEMYFVELDLDKILPFSSKSLVNLWPKYPPQIEDITLKLPAKSKVGEVLSAIRTMKNVSNTELTTVYENAYTFRVWYQDESKTLNDKEVETVRKKIVDLVQKDFGATSD